LLWVLAWNQSENFTWWQQVGTHMRSWVLAHSSAFGGMAARMFSQWELKTGLEADGMASDERKEIAICFGKVLPAVLYKRASVSWR
jgi:hypothetical protein